MLEWIEIEATWCCSAPYLEAEQSPLAANRHDMSLDWLKANDIPLATASEIRFDPHPHIGVDVNFNVTKGEFSLIANWIIIIIDSDTVLSMERLTRFVFCGWDSSSNPSGKKIKTRISDPVNKTEVNNYEFFKSWTVENLQDNSIVALTITLTRWLNSFE